MKSNSLKHSHIIVRLCGTMDITSASHSEGSEFDPHQNSRIFSKNVTWQELGSQDIIVQNIFPGL